jgi:protein-S-isoprenylcysteine O-methyltransferase Ste14
MVALHPIRLRSRSSTGMELVIGTVLALSIGLFATVTGLDRDRAFYPTVMIVIALYYALFAAMSGSMQALARTNSDVPPSWYCQPGMRSQFARWQCRTWTHHSAEGNWRDQQLK